MIRLRAGKRGFTLIELLLVLAIIGLAFALIIPRAMRAQVDNKFSQVRQYGSEIAGHIMTWAQNQTKAQRPETTFTLKDFLMDDITEVDNAGVLSNKLVDKYTGNQDFAAIGDMIGLASAPKNPFNEVSYFKPGNDDTAVPSKKPGLLYLASQLDPAEAEYRNFYLLFTSTMPDEKGSYWFGGMDHRDADKIRRGVFVGRLYDDKEYGGGEAAYMLGGQPVEEQPLPEEQMPAPQGQQKQ